MTIKNAPENAQGDDCETRIGVEPFTGQIMSGIHSFCSVRFYFVSLFRDRYARKRMQTNLYIPAADEAPSLFDFYNQNMYAPHAFLHCIFVTLYSGIVAQPSLTAT